MSVFSQAQESDSFAAFEGKWKHTKLFCRSFRGATINEYEAKLIKGGFEGFYPDVELKFSSTTVEDNGKIVPAKNLEKAVTQGSCKLEKPVISPMNQKSDSNYIWSKNRIQLIPRANIQGVQYYEMNGYLVDKKVNYSDIRDCGRKDGALVSMEGVISALFTYVRYDLGKSYFNVEADRKYTVSISNGRLALEFFDASICSKSDERVVMQFARSQ